jgi:hypothetical protein
MSPALAAPSSTQRGWGSIVTNVSPSSDHGRDVLRREDWNIVKTPTGIAEDALISSDAQRRLHVEWSRFPAGVSSGGGA